MFFGDEGHVCGEATVAMVSQERRPRTLVQSSGTHLGVGRKVHVHSWDVAAGPEVAKGVLLDLY